MELTSCFSNIEDEINKKNTSMLIISDESENEFKYLCQKKLDSLAITEINKTLDFVKKIKTVEKNHPSSKAYYIHSIRVASLCLQVFIKPEVDVIKTALVHNFFEITGNNEQILKEAGFSDFTCDGVKLATIDRSKSNETSYLNEYFSNLFSFDERMAIIRCLDKLDNLLAFELIEKGKTRENFLFTFKLFVLPLAKKINKDLFLFMSNVLKEIEFRGCNTAKQQEYKNVLTEVLDKNKK